MGKIETHNTVFVLKIYFAVQGRIIAVKQAEKPKLPYFSLIKCAKILANFSTFINHFPCNLFPSPKP